MRDLHLAPELFRLPKDTGRAILLDYYEGEPDFLFHYHPEFELVMTRGSFGRRLIGNVVSDYSRIDVVLLGPNLPHTWASEPNPGRRGKVDNTVVHFTRESLGVELLEKPELRAVNELLHRSRAGLHFHETAIVGVVETLMDRIVSLEDRGFSQYLSFLEVLDVLSRSHDASAIVSDQYDCTGIDREHESLAKVLVYLHEHSDTPVMLANVAAAAHMSIPTFCRFFRRTTGTTFVDYLNGWRVDRACIFLQETDESILDISLRVGFQNLSNFNRQFKRRKGMTPGEYRRSRFDLPAGAPLPEGWREKA